MYKSFYGIEISQTTWNALYNISTIGLIALGALLFFLGFICKRYTSKTDKEHIERQKYSFYRISGMLLCICSIGIRIIVSN